MSRSSVHISPLADKDIDHHFAFIARDNMTAAARFLDAIELDSRKLAQMPGLGAKREYENARYADIRSYPISGFRNYLIFYKAIGKGIEIVRVLHGAQNVDAFFER